MDVATRRPCVVGLRLDDAEPLLEAAGEKWSSVITRRPARHGEASEPSRESRIVMRVVRQRVLSDGSLELVVAGQTASLET